MHEFLTAHREELISLCREKVSQRPHRAASEAQLANGIPLFLDQLTRTLHAEEAAQAAGEIVKISGVYGADGFELSELGMSANAHGHELSSLGFTVGEVVFDYGDLCQSITELAMKRHVGFGIDEFQTLNRCLDNAIAIAVAAFNLQREAELASQHRVDTREQIGFLVHELRNALGTATLAAHALEVGSLPMSGATGTVLKRSLADMKTLMTRALDEVRGTASLLRTTFNLASFIADVNSASGLDARARGFSLVVPTVDASLMVHGDAELLQAALSNLLQNAYKFSHPHSEIHLRAYAGGTRAFIEVADCCGGLPLGAADKMFSPFHQRSDDKSGLGLGLSIARRSIEAESGTLSVRDVPGTGCVFTISLPLFFEVTPPSAVASTAQV